MTPHTVITFVRHGQVQQIGRHGHLKPQAAIRALAGRGVTGPIVVRHYVDGAKPGSVKQTAVMHGEVG